MLISQVIPLAESTEVNFMKTDATESKKGFQSKISLCKKEAKETLHWLIMIAKDNPNKKDNWRKLWKVACKLTLIFS